MRILAPSIALILLACARPHGRPASVTEAPRAQQASYGSGFSAADRERAERYLAEAATLCARDGGRLWGISLCGPIAIVDPTTRAIATNEPPPQARQPAAFGFANAAVEWGGRRWTTVMWQQMVYADDQRLGTGFLLVHELFHRVQPQLGFLLPDAANDHLDTVQGRYWMQLEWRALEAALEAAGEARRVALRDALAFRAARRAAFPHAAASERVAEIVEGLADYTGIALTAASREAMATHAIQRLRWVVEQPTFVRPFGYASGAAYGVLLDGWRPGWTREFTPASDLSRLLMAAARVEPTADVRSAAARHGGAELLAAEERREIERRARVADLRRRFVDGPVLILPRPRNYTFAGDVTPVGDAGSVYPGFRAEVEWGTLEAARALLAADGNTVTVPAPANMEGSTASGDGWRLILSPGWSIRPGSRRGDYQLVRAPGPPPAE